MLMVGTIQHLFLTEKTVILNFCSLNESYPRLHLLPPNYVQNIIGNPYIQNYQIAENSEYAFDVDYANWIMSNDDVFIDFMQIIYPLYEGKDVFLLVTDDPILDMYVQSLLKFIQQRYGYNGFYVTCTEDVFNAVEQTVSDFGVINLIADKERLSFLAAQDNLPKEAFDVLINGGTYGV